MELFERRSQCILDAPRRQADAHDESTRVARREQVSGRCRRQLAIAHNFEVEARAVPLPEKHGRKVEGCDIRIVNGRRAETEEQLGFFDVAPDPLHAQAVLLGLHRTRSDGHARLHAGKSLFDFCASVFGVEVADHDQRHIASDVMVREEGDNVVPPELADSRLGTNDGAPIGVRVED